MFRVLTCLTDQHDWRLVVLAGIVCFLASLAAINLLQRARATDKRTRAGWLATAGAATGCGIWATHFIGILAYHAGGPIEYDLGLTLLSLIAAMVVTTAGLGLAVQWRSPWSAPLGGAVVGVGVAIMHYTGIYALQFPGHVTWSAGFVVASVVLGIVFAAAALWLAKRHSNARAIAGAALLLTLAIVLHHFVAMAAMEIVPDPARMAGPFALSPALLSIVIASVTVAVLGICLFAAVVDHRRARDRRQLIAQSKEQLRAQNVMLETALDHMTHGLCMFDAHSRLVVANQRYLQMYGLSAERVKPGCLLHDLIAMRRAGGSFSGDVDAYCRETFASIAAGVSTTRFTELPDGRTILIAQQPMANGGWVATHLDVTEPRHAEHALREAREQAERSEQEARAAHGRLLDAIEAIPEGIVLFDAEDRFVLWNKRYAELYRDVAATVAPGKKFEDTLRAAIALGRHPDAVGREEAWLAQRMALHGAPESTIEQQLSNGRWMRIQERRTADGGTIGVRIDITELKQREASFRLLFDSNPVPMWLYEIATLRFLAVNDAAIAHYGYTRQQFLGMTLLDIRPVADHDAVAALAGIKHNVQEPNRMWRHKKADGTLIDVVVYRQSLTYEGISASLVAAVDLTDRNRAENELRRTRAFLDSIVENMPAMLTVKDMTEQRYTLVNRAAEGLFGMSRNAMIGKMSHDIFPKEQADLLATTDRAALQSDEVVDVGEQVIRQADNNMRVVTLKKLAIAGEDGKPRYVLTLAADITERKHAEDELRRTQGFLDTIVENMPAILTVKDAIEQRYILVNRAAETLFGIPRQDMLGKQVGEIFSGDEAELFTAQDRELLLSPGVLSTGEHKVRRPDNSFSIVANKKLALLGDDGKPRYILALSQDITERKQAEEELQRTQSFLDTIVENVPATITVKDAKTLRYALMNRAGEEFFGRPRDEMIGKTAEEIFPPDIAEAITERDYQLLKSGRQDFYDEQPIHAADHQFRRVNSRRLVVSDANGQPQYLVGVIQDVTEHRQAEARIAHMAHHDTLTDLPNRTAFNERFRNVLDRAVASGGHFALMCIDLDRFKEVNDVFGHAVGDAVLCEVARRLTTAADGAFLARVGGDEFTVIASDAGTPEAAEHLAEQLLASLTEEFHIENHQVRMGLSVGIAVYPTDGADSSTLLANADAALYRAKADGRGSIRFFEPDMDTRLRERRALQHDLASAIEAGQLMLYYQPQAQIGGEVIGFEALVRWRHPSRGMIPPAIFIPLAEETGLIIPIGEWILREACREAASWPHKLQIAINLSPVQFRHGDLASLVHAVLLETGLASSRLELEITEGVLIDDFSRAITTLRRLKALGVRIAMDDFGTGYSSLSYLQSFPFDKIKIDQTFISNLERNTQSAAIVRAVIALGRGLHLPVVAEGVETKEQLAFLTHEACDEIQGYLIGHPLPIKDYAGLTGRDVQAPKAALAG